MQGYARPSDRSSAGERAYAPVERAYRPIAQTYSRADMEAYNRTPAPISRPQATAVRRAVWRMDRGYYKAAGYSGGYARSRAIVSGTGGELSAGGLMAGAPVQRSSRVKAAKSYEKAAKSSGMRGFGGESYKEPKFKEPSSTSRSSKEPKMPKRRASAAGTRAPLQRRAFQRTPLVTQ